MNRQQTLAIACLLLALLIKRRRRNRVNNRRRLREIAIGNRTERHAPRKSVPTRRRKRMPAARRIPAPKSVIIKEEMPSSDDEILARLCDKDDDAVVVKEEVDALAIKDEYDADDDMLSDEYDNETFLDESGIKRQKEGSYVCDGCDETFTKKSYLRWHIAECHSTVPSA